MVHLLSEPLSTRRSKFFLSSRLVAVELGRRNWDGNGRLACALEVGLPSGWRIEVSPRSPYDLVQPRLD
jgi:hypothetical protein